MDGLEAGLEDALGEEQLDVQFARNSTLRTEADEATGLLKKLLQGVGSFVGGATVLVLTQVQSTYLQVTCELRIVVGKEMGAHGRKRDGQSLKLWAVPERVTEVLAVARRSGMWVPEAIL